VNTVKLQFKIVVTAVCLLAVVLGGVLPTSRVSPVQGAMGDRITINNNQFMAGGQRIWLNGANTPWNTWDDFGGNFNYSWWDNHFRTLNENGINVTRVWIVCSGDVGININSDGVVSGATARHWEHLDALFEIARNRNVYVMPTLMSFDSFKSERTNHQRWRRWINSNSNIDSYVNNYLIPFVNRYKNNPYLFAIDLINEPDWSVENGFTNWGQFQQYFARASKAIHDNSSILVTVGFGVIKYNSSTVAGAVDNMASDRNLQAKVNSPNARLDFWSPHYYNWMDPYWPIPFYTSPANYGLDASKPSMIGETPALGSGGNGTASNSLTNDYERAYQNGWQGVMAWTSNGVDVCGNMTHLGPATRAFRDKYRSLVFPGSGTPSQPTATPAAPTATQPPSGGASLEIYGDSTSWNNWSWSGTYNFSNTSTVYNGARSIAVTYSAWGGLSLQKNPAVSTSGYSRLSFWAHGGSSGTRKIRVNIERTSGVASPSINLDVPSGRWTQFNINLSDLGSPATIYRINIQDAAGSNQPVFYIDDIRLTGGGAAPTAAPVQPTATSVPPTATRVPPTATVAPPQSTATSTTFLPLVIYNDSTTWNNWSWAGNYNFGNTSPVYSGSKSIAVAYNAWGGLSLHQEPSISTGGYSQLSFWAHGGSSGTRRIKVYLQSSSNNAGPEFNIDVPSGRWTQYNIRLSELGSPSTIHRINFQDRSGANQPVFYLDDVQLVQ
jgi:hypothetical protein